MAGIRNKSVMKSIFWHSNTSKPSQYTKAPQRQCGRWN